MRANKRTIPVETLRRLLVLNPETGQLFWKPRPSEMFSAPRFQRRWNSRYAGQEALAHVNQGYRVGAILGVNCLKAHRVVWALHYGEWPDFIDHVNRDRSDNRVSNLRSVPMTENMKNKPLYKNNSSGVNGVFWSEKGKSWCARIADTHLGSFVTKQDATAARKSAEVEHAYHQNHGR